MKKKFRLENFKLTYLNLIIFLFRECCDENIDIKNFLMQTEDHINRWWSSFICKHYSFTLYLVSYAITEMNFSGMLCNFYLALEKWCINYALNSDLWVPVSMESETNSLSWLLKAPPWQPDCPTGYSWPLPENQKTRVRYFYHWLLRRIS